MNRVTRPYADLSRPMQFSLIFLFSYNRCYYERYISFRNVVQMVFYHFTNKKEEQR